VVLTDVLDSDVVESDVEDTDVVDLEVVDCVVVDSDVLRVIQTEDELAKTPGIVPVPLAQRVQLAALSSDLKEFMGQGRHDDVPPMTTDAIVTAGVNTEPLNDTITRDVPFNESK
jgi:predicted RNA methylase